MQNEYAESDFSDDMSTLKKLVEQYQSGGKGSDRYFKVVMVNGSPVDASHSGRYTVKEGQSPGTAARRAFTQVCRRLKNRSDKTITLKETTQGSTKKEHTYKCKMHKLKKPRKGPIDKKTGKPVMFYYESHCTKVTDKGDMKGGYYI